MDIETAADLTNESSAKLAKAKSRGLTCNPSYVIGYPKRNCSLASMNRRNSHYPTLGTEKRIATYRRKVNF